VDKEWTRLAAEAAAKSLDEAFWAIVDASFDDVEMSEICARCRSYEQALREDGA
jgi:hypothetical protein